MSADMEPPLVRPAPEEPTQPVLDSLLGTRRPARGVRREPEEPKKPVLEMLLDPRGIQWLLASGGGLFVLGLVLFLYTKGVFENKYVVATGLGVANAAALAAGWTVVRRTRYQTAGKALALLACLVMPLNLWFYHAQGIVTLDGHLWVVGLIVCGLYAASAWLLRDRTFVTVLTLGVVMTGLLLLADLGRFWEIAGPATFLVVLGLIGIHVERAFPDIEGPFGRKQFGRAFFDDGHACLATGLLLLLGAQLAGHWLHPFFHDLYASLQAVPSPVVTETWGQLLALGLALAGVYAYLYSDFVVRRIGAYLVLAAACLVWAEVMALELLHLQVGTEAVLATLAGTALVANVAAYRSKRGEATRALPALGLGLALVPVALGVVLHARSTSLMLSQWRYDGGWAFVAAMALTAISCRIGAHLSRHERPHLAAVYFFATAAAEMVGAAALLRQLGFTTWSQQAWLLMLIPLAHCVAARMYRGHPWAGPVLAAGQAATFVMLASSLATTLRATFAATGSLNLTLAGFFALAALFFALTAVLHGRQSGVYFATLTGCAAVWQGLLGFGVPDEYYALAFAAVGLVMLTTYRAASADGVGRFTGTRAGFDCANGLLTAAFVAAVLIGLSRLLSGQPSWRAVGLCAAQAVVALVAAGIARHDGWRRVYVVAAVAQGLLALLTLEMLSQLTVWQKAELFGTVAGVVVLVAGHLGWYRERGGVRSDLVSFALGFGSALVLVPLGAGLLWHRSTPAFSWPEELGVLALGLALLASGSVLRIKATTLTGTAMVALFVLTLPAYARGMLKEVQTAALLLAAGGGLVFGTGLVLAVFRDRLLALPNRMRNREGVFVVLGWR